MIRSTLRRLRPRATAEGARKVPTSMDGLRHDLGMFDRTRTADAAEKAHKLERLYHKGQKLAWDGKRVLPDLIAQHGGIRLDERERDAIRALFAVILWGELAAWKISTDMATYLEDYEAKMAATSQAHDEARHFYVMHDYLDHLGDTPTDLGTATVATLEGVLRADTLAKKLVGMQLMIEPMALTLFQTVRERQLEPVLCDLLVNYERDEARHVALGVLHLPKLLSGMTIPQRVEMWRWQMRMYRQQFAMLHELKPHLEVLGVHPRDVLELGREKQILAAKLLFEELGYQLQIISVFRAYTDFRAAWEFPLPGESTRKRDRLWRAWQAASSNTIDDVTGPLSKVAA